MISQIENFFGFGSSQPDNREIREIFREISRVAGYLWERGWAERNAGNFSVNISEFYPEKEREKLSQFPFIPLAKEFPDLVGQLFLVSRAGSRLRYMMTEPAGNSCFIYISESGSACHVITGEEEENVRPTSEITTHLAIQQLMIQQGSVARVVLHAHVTELIALTHLRQFCETGALNRVLFGMHPEAMTYIREGVGFVPYMLPGSESIAQSTLQCFEDHSVAVWEKHGCIALAPSLSEAFEVMDILAKSARIYFTVKHSGENPEGLTGEQLKELKDHSS